MIITTERLVLEPLGMEHLESTFGYSSNIENTRYMRFLPDMNIGETREFLEGAQAQWKLGEQRYYEFAVMLDGVHIGAVSVYHEVENNEDVGELGWIIDQPYWGQGYAYEASRALIEYSLNELRMKILVAHCDSANTGSYRLMEKLGMKFVCRHGGRHNKASDEEREELTYEIRESMC